MKEVMAYILLASLATAFLWFFSCIWVYGSHYIQEPNQLILTCETIGVLLVLGLAIWNLIDLAKRGRAKSEN